MEKTCTSSFTTVDRQELEQSKEQIKYQVKELSSKMIRFESLAFGSKLLFDYLCRQQIQQKRLYNQKQTKVHFKIGALSGFALYLANIPLMYLEKSPSPENILKYANQGTHRMSPIRLIDKFKTLLQINTIKALLKTTSFLGLSGSVIYRSLYFGGYEKVRTVNSHPVNEFLVAPIAASMMAALVMPIDTIRFMRQLPSYKDMPLLDIISSKEFKPFNLSNKALLSRIAKQSISMSLFVSGQKAYSTFFQRSTEH